MIGIDLSGKTAVITGGSSQLGRAITRTLAAAGADVAVHYFGSQERAEGVANDARALGRRAITVKADIKEKDSIFAMRDAVTKELGDADIIVTNATSGGPWGKILEAEAFGYEESFRANVLQNLYMAQAFAPAMIEKKAGRIIAINTECTMLYLPTQSSYVTGKRGMDGLLRILAKEIGPSQITVNQVAPGWMISDRDRDSGETAWPDYEPNVPMKRRGTDQDIANAVVFLASDLAKFITGCFLPVTGGNIMPAV